MRRKRRRGGRDPFAIGAIALVLIAAAVYLGFTKDVPLLNNPYELKAAFRDSSGIQAGSPVRIAGVNVGKVSRVEPTDPGSPSTVVTMEIGDAGRPVREDARAVIRPRIFLEGNFFVDLAPGSPRAPEIDEGATIPASRTGSPVQFDEVLKALRKDTRRDLRTLLIELGRTRRAGGGRAFNRSLRYQAPAYRYSAIVADALLGERRGDLGDYIRDQGIVAAALDRDRARLRSLVTHLNRTAGALADRDDELRAAVGELPRTLRAGMPALAALNASFPSVRRFASAARPGIRSTGPAARELLPLVRQLRGLVSAPELRGLSRDLRRATGPLAGVAIESVDLLQEARALASCTDEVLVPWGNDRVPDPNFPSTGPVHQENAKFLPGLAGESRSFDANNQWFKVLGGGGVETFTLGDGLFGTALEPIVGVNPPPDPTRPPFEPEVPCETQERPNLETRPQGGPRRVETRSGSPAVRRRAERAKDVAITLLRQELRERGDRTPVVDRLLTLPEIEAAARRNGRAGQLARLRAKERAR